MEQFTLKATHGAAEIPVFHTPASPATAGSAAAGAVAGVVQYIHGMGDRAERNGELYASLAEAGYAVYAADLPGHGTRRDGPVFFGRRGGFEAVVSECGDLRRELERRHPAEPRFVIGHSMGTLFARLTVAENPRACRGLVLSGPVGPLGPMRLVGRAAGAVGKVLRGPERANRLFAKLSFGAYAKSVPDRRTEEDWLSRDAAEVDAYRADPVLGGPFSSAFVTDLMRAIAAAHSSETVAALAGNGTVPLAGGANGAGNGGGDGTGGGVDAAPGLFVVAGDADPVVEYGAAVRRIAESISRAGNDDVDFRLYPGARHELFHETNRREVFDDLIRWLAARSG
jgi:alpha-beta hydrolase superfamily lysophospholipase